MNLFKTSHPTEHYINPAFIVEIEANGDTTSVWVQRGDGCICYKDMRSIKDFIEALKNHTV